MHCHERRASGYHLVDRPASLDVLDESPERRGVEASFRGVTGQEAERVPGFLAVEVTREDTVGAEAQELQALDRQPPDLLVTLVMVDDDLLTVVECDRAVPARLGIGHPPFGSGHWCLLRCQNRNLTMA